MELLAGPLVLLFVAVAGGIGSVIRLFAATFSGYLPWGILIANVAASFLVGLAQQSASLVIGIILISGLAGGLSTFSTFAGQTLDFVRKGRISQGLINTVATLVLSSTAIWLGQLLGALMLK
jgi:CrcB protein